VEMILPPASRRTAETVWVHSVRNAVRSEVVHLHGGFHISLHPVRQTSLVQIIRSRTGGAVVVKMASNKKRLTRNTFVSCRPHCSAHCPVTTTQRPRNEHVARCLFCGH
jgi:hypothetical protein